MILVFDLDGVLCTNSNGEYHKAEPIMDTINLIKDLKSLDYYIIIRTARGMGKSKGDINKAINNLYVFTKDQLEHWGVVYDELHFGKPYADLYIDDKAFKFDNNISELKDVIARIQKG